MKHSVTAGLTSVIIPNSVSTVGIGAFQNCTDLASATLPNNVGFTSIENFLFYQCSSLSSVNIPDSVTYIGNGAFQNCDFTSITIPDSVSTIKLRAFQGCDRVESLTLPNNAGFTTIEQFTFAELRALLSLTIPNTVTTIGLKAFRNLTLTTVEIPSSVSSIGQEAFQYCTQLGTINCLATTAPALGSNPFSGVAATEIHVPVGATGYGTTYGGLTVVSDL